MDSIPSLNSNLNSEKPKVRLRAADFEDKAIKLDKIHDILQKIHVYTVDETIEAIDACKYLFLLHIYNLLLMTDQLHRLAETIPSKRGIEPNQYRENLKAS